MGLETILVNLKRYYKSKGLVGISFSTICKLKLRGGQLLNQEPIDPLKVRERVDQILRDERISESYKKDFASVRNSPIFPDYESIKANKLRNSLIAKSEHSQYSKAKGKLPFLLLSPFTFAELSRLAAFRAAGLTSASLTIPGFLGFSMPCAITFSMLEMYAPEKLKLPCKLAKWTGGIAFYGLAATIDYLSAPLEKKYFKMELAIDAPELMGTLPKMSDVEELKKLYEELENWKNN
jgi:hypothetical protein